jgi:hypothetical protein
MEWSVSNFTNPYEILIRGKAEDVSTAQKALPINSKFTATVTWADGVTELCSVTVLNSPVMTANGAACRFSSYVRRQPVKSTAAKPSGEMTSAELGSILTR